MRTLTGPFLTHKVSGADYTNVSAASVNVRSRILVQTRGITGVRRLWYPCWQVAGAFSIRLTRSRRAQWPVKSSKDVGLRQRTSGEGESEQR